MKKPQIQRPDIKAGRARTKIAPPPKPGEMRPDLLSLEDPGDFNSPFDPSPEASEGLQADADGEVSAALRAVIDEKRKKHDKYRLTNDQDYYFVVCFQSKEQKMEFLDESGWIAHENRLVDGLKLAQRLGIDIKPINLPMREFSKSMPTRLRGREVIK